MSNVVIRECPNYLNVKEAVKHSINDLGGIKKFVSKEQKVLIKPNLCEPQKAETAAVTHPLIIKAIIELLKPVTRNIYVGDLPAINKSGITKETIVTSGLMQVLRETKTPYVVFEDKPFIPKEIDNFLVLEKTDFASIYFYADVVINVPKLKSHGLTYLTGAVKNLFGLIHPGERQYLHKNFKEPEFSKGLIDIYSFMKPKVKLNIMDAVLAMEGDEGPSYGDPVETGYILLSADAVALDTVAAKITGHSPLAIPTNKYGNMNWPGSGEINKIKSLGSPIKEVRFKPHSNYTNRNEKIKENKAVPVINDNCIKCGNCKDACPVNAIKWHNNSLIINEKKCIKCYCCLENCVHGGISIINNTISKTADVIRLGKKCNQSCVFCTAVDDIIKDQPTQRIKENIEFLLKLGHNRLVFTGGEPTEREDIEEIIEFASRQGFYVELQTNAINLSNYEFLKRLIEKGVKQFTVSIHSHKKDIYQEITGKDHLNKALKGIENLTRLGVPLSFSHVINRLNYEDIKEFIQFILNKTKNNSEFYLSLVRPNPALLNDEKIVPSLREIEPYLNNVLEYLKNKQKNFSVEGVPFCYMRGYEKNNAEAQRLKSQPNYHIEEGVFVEDTHRQHILKNKAKSSECKKCYYEKTCPGVWKEYAEIYGTAELNPIKEEHK
ncbi:MAG: DUF362 domain-containing protein [Nanoarchaeota archaeon]